MLDELGLTRTYNHYLNPECWAYERSTTLRSDVESVRIQPAAPLTRLQIISWPQRNPVQHDRLGDCGTSTTMPIRNRADNPGHPRRRSARAIKVAPRAGSTLSHAYSVDDPSEPSARATHFYYNARLPGIWHVRLAGRHHSTTLSGWRRLQRRNCERTTPTPTRATAWPCPRQPGRFRELVNLWFAEAGDTVGPPLDDRSLWISSPRPRPQLSNPPRTGTLFPYTARYQRPCGEHPQPFVHDRRPGYIPPPAPGSPGSLTGRVRVQRPLTSRHPLH